MKPNEEIRLPDTMEEVYKSIKEGFAKGDRYMFKADTLEELADKIGVNKKNFIETVKKYNESCEKGVDLDFFKRKDALVSINKPPYYAFFGKLMTDGAFGGVQVNPDMQAYKPDGGLVEGLYVTGDFASGRFINLGGVKRQVLNDLSWAFSSGFLAGTNAGRYLESIG
jgi:fumarate reductase flavoprotein subunit